jgi:hypothetical protein
MEMTSPAARNDEEEQHAEGLASEGDVKGDTFSCKTFSPSRTSKTIYKTKPTRDYLLYSDMI